jgi:hypothetical protein
LDCFGKQRLRREKTPSGAGNDHPTPNVVSFDALHDMLTWHPVERDDRQMGELQDYVVEKFAERGALD